MGTPTVSPVTASRWERIGARLQAYVDQGIFPGFLSIVMQHGKMVHRHLCGFQDVAAGLPVREDTIYRIYSMTKPVTAVALMMLFEEGKFFLDEPISAFLPEFKTMHVYAGKDANGIKTVPAEQPITFRQLLTHTSGLGYGNSAGPVEDLIRQAGLGGGPGDSNQSLPEFIRAVSRLPLAYQPGARWSYGLGLDVAGLLVSVLSGLPFEEFLRLRLFEPLGMNDTGFFVPPEKQERLAVLYGLRGGRLNPVPLLPDGKFLHPPAAPAGGGGLVSTAGDYLRFTRMLLNGGQLDGVQVIGRRTVDLITSNHLAPELLPWKLFNNYRTDGLGFGLGGYVVVDPVLNGTLASAGTYSWSGAASTQMFIDPRADLTAVLMTQTLMFSPDTLPPVNEIWQRLIYQALD